jgi:uncharacterized protein YbaR (Trm112 family)
MIPEDFLAKLRCPLGPSEVHLEQTEGALVCQRCRLRFPIIDGFPSLRVAAAELPAGCVRIEDLPCRRKLEEPKP